MGERTNEPEAARWPFRLSRSLRPPGPPRLPLSKPFPLRRREERGAGSEESREGEREGELRRLSLTLTLTLPMATKVFLSTLPTLPTTDPPLLFSMAIAISLSL